MSDDRVGTFTHDLVGELGYAHGSASILGRRSGARRSAAARRLAAARMLPAGDRARYGEEFESELADDAPLVVSLPVTRCVPPVVEALREVLHTHPGPTEVHLKLRGNQKATVFRLDDKLRVTASPALHADLEQLLGPSGSASVLGRRSGARRSAAARRLAAAAARMLPAGDRARYGEEFGSELAEIARAGGGRRAQLAYASRQVISAVRLRAALASPRRRSAAP